MCQGIILSSYYWGFMISQFPAVFIAVKYSGKYTLGFGVLIGGILTALSPAAIRLGDSLALIAVRFTMGLTCGVVYPALNILMSEWIPLEERSISGSVIYAGAPLGIVFGSSVSGLLLEYSSIGWPIVFYFFGGCTIAWFFFFVALCYDTPVDHPFISDDEIRFLHERLSEYKHRHPPPVPWKYILTSKPVWAVTISTIGSAWGFLTMISDLSKYMSNVLKFSIEENGLLSSLPYLCMWIGSTIASWFSDWLIATDKLSITNVRKLGATVSSVGPALFLIAASYAGCDKIFVVTMITAGMTLFGASTPSLRVNPLDLCPNYAGSLMAFVTFFAAITGIISPYVVGLLTPNQTLEEWRIVFFIVSGFFIFTNLIFLLFASGETQEWNDPKCLNIKNERVNKIEIKRLLTTRKSIT